MTTPSPDPRNVEEAETGTDVGWRLVRMMGKLGVEIEQAVELVGELLTAVRAEACPSCTATHRVLASESIDDEAAERLQELRAAKDIE